MRLNFLPLVVTQSLMPSQLSIDLKDFLLSFMISRRSRRTVEREKFMFLELGNRCGRNKKEGDTELRSQILRFKSI